jgi:hypothetical protein
VAADLSGLDEPHPAPEVSDDEVTLGGWRARVTSGALEVDGDGDVDDWWRVVAVAAWRHLDDTGSPARTDGVNHPR